MEAASGARRERQPAREHSGFSGRRLPGRVPGREASYESVKSYLDGQWAITQSRKAIEQEIDRLRDDYEVMVDYNEEASR